jgi:hypothetical protein
MVQRRRGRETPQIWQAFPCGMQKLHCPGAHQNCSGVMVWGAVYSILKVNGDPLGGRSLEVRMILCQPVMVARPDACAAALAKVTVPSPCAFP